jgi:hypothetical protein
MSCGSMKEERAWIQSIHHRQLDDFVMLEVEAPRFRVQLQEWLLDVLLCPCALLDPALEVIVFIPTACTPPIAQPCSLFVFAAEQITQCYRASADMATYAESNNCPVLPDLTRAFSHLFSAG